MASIIEETLVEEMPVEETSAKEVPAGEALTEEKTMEEAATEAHGAQCGSPPRATPPTPCDSSPELLPGDDVQSELNGDAIQILPLPSQCPIGHDLETYRAPAGHCDGCRVRVAERQLVSACRTCNWYVCTTCRPIQQCPRAHTLHASSAVAGACDGCRRSVQEGETVSACQLCNWYLCASCQPCQFSPTACDASPELLGDRVQNELSSDARQALPRPQDKDPSGIHASPSQCPGKHALEIAKAPAGQCDGCSGKVVDRQLVSACVACNWYLCITCRPIQQCPSAHPLHASAAAAGTCDGCHRSVKQGETVSDCRLCDWYLCASCQPGEAPPAGCDASLFPGPGDSVQNELSQEAAQSFTRVGDESASDTQAQASQCPTGHELKSVRAPAGQCDGCGGRVEDRQLVSACVACNWYLCTTCQPIQQCPSAHPLHASAAVAGTCDGCRRSVREGEAVSDCRLCDWYLCASCQPCEDPSAGHETSPEVLPRDSAHIVSSGEDAQALPHQHEERPSDAQAAPTECPSGHKLEIAKAPAGQCDGCSGKVVDRQLVSACVACNWYLCTTCLHIQQCPSAHPLRASAAAAGTCDGCQRSVKQGETVSDCRLCAWYLCTNCQPCEALPIQASPSQCPTGHELETATASTGQCDSCGGMVASGQIVSTCATCNWYACSTCRSIAHCPSAHALCVSASVAGTCDGCHRSVRHGEIVSDCRVCNWYLCAGCQPLSESPAGVSLSSQRTGSCALCKRPTAEDDMTVTSNGHVWHICEACTVGRQGKGALASAADATQHLLQCPQGHAAGPRAAEGGQCSQCSKSIGEGELALGCGSCEWWICMECQPVDQCTKGHKLESRPAIAGTCDGCRKRVEANEPVLDCKHCNWYLCERCHLPAAARCGA